MAHTNRESQGFLREQAGFTLLELTVVSAIVGILAGIVALAVSGRATESRSSARVADVSEVQKAVDAFAGQHPNGRFPTLNGCLPDKVLDTLSLRCVFPSQVLDVSRQDTVNLVFDIQEATADIDINRDGDESDTVKVAPIIWAKAFRSDSNPIKRFSPDFVQRDPKHAYEFLSGLDGQGSWKDGQNLDPDRLGNISPDSNGVSTSITAPTGLGSGENKIDVGLRQYPVWVLDATGTVYNLLPDGRY